VESGVRISEVQVEGTARKKYKFHNGKTAKSPYEAVSGFQRFKRSKVFTTIGSFLAGSVVGRDASQKTHRAGGAELTIGDPPVPCHVLLPLGRIALGPCPATRYLRYDPRRRRGCAGGTELGDRRGCEVIESRRRIARVSANNPVWRAKHSVFWPPFRLFRKL